MNSPLFAVKISHKPITNTTKTRKAANIATQDQKHFISAAKLISLLTLLSRILGLIRDAICLRYFGTDVWHYFTVPFMIPNLFRRLFGEGALSAALIPTYTQRLEQDPDSAKSLARSTLTALAIILTSITALALVAILIYAKLAPQTTESQLVLNLLLIMLPYMILICLVGAIAGLLNVHRFFGAPAAAPIILNLAIIAAVLYFRNYFGQTPWQQIYAVATAVIIAGLLQLLVQLPYLKKAGIPLTPNLNLKDPGLKHIVRLMAPMLIGLSVVQFNTLLDSLIAVTLSGKAPGDTFTLFGMEILYPVQVGSASYLYCAQRLYMFPLGVFGMALATAIFPSLSQHASRKDLPAFADTLSQGLRMVAFIAIPATLGMILIRTPLTQVIYLGKNFLPEDVHPVSQTLLFYTFGIAAYFTQQLIVRGFYSFHDSTTPVKVALHMVAINFAMNITFIWFLGTAGLALSTAICAVLQAAILLRILTRNYNLKLNINLTASLTRTLIATAAMTAAGFTASHYTNHLSHLTHLIATTTTCIAIYFITSLILKNPELSLLLKRK